MTLTKDKNNTQKLRKLPNDEGHVKGSNGHVTQFRWISTDAKKRHSFLMRWPIRHSSDRVLRPCRIG